MQTHRRVYCTHSRIMCKEMPWIRTKSSYYHYFQREKCTFRIRYACRVFNFLWALDTACKWIRFSKWKRKRRSRRSKWYDTWVKWGQKIAAARLLFTGQSRNKTRTEPSTESKQKEWISRVHIASSWTFHSFHNIISVRLKCVRFKL